MTVPCDFVRAWDRAVGWVVTGPPGHLWSALADMAIIWARYLTHKLRGRL